MKKGEQKEAKNNQIEEKREDERLANRKTQKQQGNTFA